MLESGLESVKEAVGSGRVKEHKTDPAGVKNILATALFIGLEVDHVKGVRRSQRHQDAFIIFNSDGLGGNQLTIYGQRYAFIIIRRDGREYFTSGVDHLKVSL